MPRAWRITKAGHADHAFDGEGARLFGGRWSSPGTRVIYVSEHLSLAVLEVLVHLQQTAALADYVLFSVDVPDAAVQSLADSELPERWREFPAPSACQAIGDGWVRENRALLLRVPSAIVPREANFLLNPTHPDFQHIVIDGPFPLDVDPRVLRR